MTTDKERVKGKLRISAIYTKVLQRLVNEINAINAIDISAYSGGLLLETSVLGVF